MKKASFESVSQNNGIRFLSGTDRKIYSVGISTGGEAEITMARANKERVIIATTIDFYRTQPSQHIDSLIEVLAIK